MKTLPVIARSVSDEAIRLLPATGLLRFAHYDIAFSHLPPFVAFQLPQIIDVTIALPRYLTEAEGGAGIPPLILLRFASTSIELQLKRIRCAPFYRSS
jgi:hypothetical protein